MQVLIPRYSIFNTDYFGQTCRTSSRAIVLKEDSTISIRVEYQDLRKTKKLTTHQKVAKVEI
jgi:hypothetical protein